MPQASRRLSHQFQCLFSAVCLICLLFGNVLLDPLSGQYLSTGLGPSLALAQSATPVSSPADSSSLATSIKQASEQAQEKAALQSAEEKAAVDMAWASRSQEVLLILDDLEVLRKNLPGILSNLDVILKSAQKEYQRLFALSQLSRGLPSELTVISQQLSSLRRALKDQLSEINLMNSNLAQRQEEFALMKKDLQAHLMSEHSAELNKSTSEYLTSLNQAEKNLQAMRSRLDVMLAPASTLDGKLDAAIQRIDSQLPKLWQNFYLTPSSTLFDLELWQNTPPQLSNWIGNASSAMSTELPVTLQGWSKVLLRFAFVWILGFTLISVFRLRHNIKKTDPAKLQQSRWRLFPLGLPLLNTGLAIYFASWSNHGGVYQSLFILGNLCMLWAIMSIAWSLRRMELDLQEKKEPLNRLFVPATLGAVLLFLNPPPLILALVWTLTMSSLLFYLASSRKTEHCPLLERTLLGVFPYIGAVSAFISILGWSRLGIPLFLLSLAFSVSIQLGMAMTSLLYRKAEKVDKSGFGAILHAILLGLGAPLVWLLAVVALAPWFSILPGSTYILKEGMEQNLNVGSFSFNFLRIIGLLFLFYFANAAVVVGKSFLYTLPGKLPRINRGVIVPMQTALTYSVWGIFGLIALNALGMSLTSLTVIAGGLSVGLGFGLQTVFNNFISGIILIFGRSLLEGDTIQIGETWGTVRKISIRSTMVETVENAIIFVPNSEFISQRLTNWTRNNNNIRREITVGVAYGSDLELVKELLLQAAQEHARVMIYPAPVLLFQDFGANSLDFSLRFWVDDLNFALSTCSEIRWRIDRLFREHAIIIPFPQLDVHTKPEAQTPPPAN